MQGPYYAPPPVQPPPAPPHQQQPGWSQSGWLLLVVICSGLFVLFMAILATSLDTLPRSEEATKGEAPAIEEPEPEEQAAEHVPGDPLAPDPSRGVAAHPKSPEVMWDIGPCPQVSSWDGIFPQAAAWFEMNLDDYWGSNVIAVSKPRATPFGWHQTVRIRGTNRLGAKVVNEFNFYVKQGKLVLVL